MQLVFDQVNKSFADHHVLKDLSFQAESGKALGLLGRNGAGKTTSIRILMNVFGPDSGDVLLDGQSILNKKEDVRSFGYLPEEKGLYQKLQILHQMVYIGGLRGLTKRQARTNARYWLDRLGMLDHQNRKLETLSKGNQQKIQLAVALITNPQVIILDEPFSGLDPVNSLLLRDVVRDLVQEGRLVLFSSHQMTYVESFCDQIAILDQGQIVLQGQINEVKRSYPRNRISIRLGTARTSLTAAEALAKFNQLRQAGSIASPISQVEAGTDGIFVQLQAAEQKDQLLQEMVSLGLPIERFEVVEPSLEDIFVSMTADRKEDLPND